MHKFHFFMIAKLAASMAVASPFFVFASSASAQGAATCLVGSHEGFEDPDARTATGIVCDALREKGVAIGEPQFAAPPGPAYRVSLERLGTSGFITLQRLDGGGTLVTQRRLQLARIEETPVVAPRLAAAILENQSMDSTRKVGRVGEAEANQRGGQLRGDFGIGPRLGASYFVGLDQEPVPTFGVQLQYETDHAAFFAGAQFLVGNSDDFELFGFSADAGGRYLFLASDFSPYVGGGLNLSTMEAGYDSSFSGVAAYAEAGVEFARLYRTHFTVGLRAIMPFGSTETTESKFDSVGAYIGEETTKRYTPIIALDVGVLF